MRIAVFTDNDFNKVNGVTTTLNALLRWAPDDLRIRIYTADDRGADEARYYSRRAPGAAIPFYRGMNLYYPWPWAYLGEARRDRVDLIHLTTPGPVGLAALFTAWRLQLPVVGSFHTDLATYTTLLSRSRLLGWLVGRYMRWPYGRCQRVLVPSQATGTALSRAGVAARSQVLWQRGVDPECFSPARRSASLRLRWRAASDTTVVMYVGRISTEKNLDAFQAVEARLIRCGRPYRLVFVGDGPMRADLQARFPGAILTGSVPHGDVGEYLASADVFAFPSRTDTAGNVVLEAQAAGLPVVVGDEGGPRENVLPGRSALVASARDDQSFAAAVERLVCNSGLRAAMAAEARAFALTRDWRSALAPLFATYRETITRHTEVTTTLVPAVPADRSLLPESVHDLS